MQLNVASTSKYKAYQNTIPLHLHNRPRQLVVQLMDCKSKVTTEMVQSVSVHCDDKENDEDPSVLPDIRKTMEQVVNKVSKRYTVKSSSLLSDVIEPYIVEFGDRFKPCCCTCPSFRRNRRLCKHFFAVMSAGCETFLDLSPIYLNHPLHNIDDDIFETRLSDTTINTPPSNSADLALHANDSFNDNADSLDPVDVDKESDQVESQSSLLPLPFKNTFRRQKAMLCSNVKVLGELCYSIKANPLLVQEVDEQITEISKRIRSEIEKESGDLLERSPVKKASISNKKSYLPLPTGKKRKHPYSGRYGETAEMMRQYYRANWTLEEIEAHKSKEEKDTIKRRKTDPKAEIPVPVATKEITLSAPEPTPVVGDVNSEVDIVETAVINNPTSHQYRSRAVLTDIIQQQISSKAMLKDDTVNLCQKILVHQFHLTEGLEDTTLKPKSFSRASGKFLQILHLKDQMHWILITKGKFEEIDIFDSLYAKKKYPKDTVKAIAKITGCSRKILKINVKSCQQQKNGVDCGVFSIANAVEILHGGNPELITYDVGKLRDHLLTSVQLGEFTPFPKSSKRAPRNRSENFCYNVYCSCRDVFFDDDCDEDSGLFMAMCCVCQEWFHRRCEKINVKVFRSEQAHHRWKCSDCDS